MPASTRVLFLRDFDRFTGGHLKVWHYFGHTLAHPTHTATIRFTRRSLQDDTNPWYNSGADVAPPDARLNGDVLFLGGHDWRQLSWRQKRRPRVPVINIIQAVHHADPTTERYTFLRHRAVRICVAPEVTEALEATGQVNGPLVTISNGIELDHLPVPAPDDSRSVDLLIAGKKQPVLARRLAARLAQPGRRIRVMDVHVPHRSETLEAINQSLVTLFLPNPSEGFYLPALEGMALRSLVVCPDAKGNRSFCLPGRNCFLPAYDEDAMVEATEEALRLPASERRALLDGATATASTHDLTRERAAFHQVLDRLPDLFW